MGRAYELSRRALFTRVVFPGALANILMGVRYALGVMWTTLIVVETISATSGRLHGHQCTGIYADGYRVTLHFDLRLTGQALRYDRKSLERLFLGWRQGGTEND